MRRKQTVSKPAEKEATKWQPATLISLIAVVVAIVTSIISATASIYAANISTSTSRLVAETQIEGQRVLARDAALRDYRKQQVSQIVAIANKRYALHVERLLALADGDQKRAMAIRERMDTGEDAFFSSQAHFAVQDDRFRRALEAFMHIDTKIGMHVAASEGKPEGISLGGPNDPWMEDLSAAANELMVAAEEYVYRLS